MRKSRSFRRGARKSFRGCFTKSGIRRKIRGIRKSRNGRHRKVYPTASRGGFRF